MRSRGKVVSEGAHGVSNKRLVRRVIKKFSDKVKTEDVKPTVGDFIRLIQLDQEMEDEQPREITVSWIEGEEKGDAPDK